MSHVGLDALAKVRDLICTPLALDVLDDLVHDRPPFSRKDRPTAVFRAVRCLVSLGAARVRLNPIPGRPPLVTLTPGGRALHSRLVEIEDWARAYDATGGAA